MSNLTLREIVARTEALRAAGKLPRPRGGGVRPKGLARPPAPCAKLGPATGQTRPCQGCGGKSALVPLRVCEEFGVCTTAKVVKLDDGTPVKCCGAMCGGYEAPSSESSPSPRTT